MCDVAIVGLKLLRIRFPEKVLKSLKTVETKGRSAIYFTTNSTDFIRRLLGLHY